MSDKLCLLQTRYPSESIDKIHIWIGKASELPHLLLLFPLPYLYYLQHNCSCVTQLWTNCATTCLLLIICVQRIAIALSRLQEMVIHDLSKFLCLSVTFCWTFIEIVNGCKNFNYCVHISSSRCSRPHTPIIHGDCCLRLSTIEPWYWKFVLEGVDFFLSFENILEIFHSWYHIYVAKPTNYEMTKSIFSRLTFNF